MALLIHVHAKPGRAAGAYYGGTVNPTTTVTFELYYTSRAGMKPLAGDLSKCPDKMGGT